VLLKFKLFQVAPDQKSCSYKSLSLSLLNFVSRVSIFTS